MRVATRVLCWLPARAFDIPNGYHSQGKALGPCIWNRDDQAIGNWRSIRFASDVARVVPEPYSIALLVRAVGVIGTAVRRTKRPIYYNWIAYLANTGNRTDVGRDEEHARYRNRSAAIPPGL